MQRILVSVTNDLTYDQRVDKICTTFKEMGFEVILIGRILSNSLPISRPYKTHRMKLLFNKGFLFYAEYNFRLFLKLFFTKKDILVANDLDTLVPNFLVSRVFNKKLVFDSHELFSEIPELVDRPKTKRFWLRIEKRIIPTLKNCYTVSDSIAKHYNNLYVANFKVIKNYPLKSSSYNTIKDFPLNVSGKKIILYQGAVNIGRGIDLMIDAMQYIDNATFIIAGEGDVLNKMKKKVALLQLNEKVLFIGKILPSKLKVLTTKADIGISLEQNLGLNYYYALPNKLFDYIQAKVPALVSDLPEMKSLALEYNIGEILKKRDAKILAKQVMEILDNGKEPWENSLEKAAGELNWENEKSKLISLFENLK